jgi:hypothetical protein
MGLDYQEWIIVIVCLISENEIGAMIDNKFEKEIYLDLIWSVANSCCKEIII